MDRGTCWAAVHKESNMTEYAHNICMSVCVCVCTLSPVLFFVTPRTTAHQAPLAMEFFRQEYWSGLPFPPPGDLPHLGIEPMSPALAGRFFTTEPPGKR